IARKHLATSNVTVTLQLNLVKRRMASSQSRTEYKYARSRFCNQWRRTNCCALMACKCENSPIRLKCLRRVYLWKTQARFTSAFEAPFFVEASCLGEGASMTLSMFGRSPESA